MGVLISQGKQKVQDNSVLVCDNCTVKIEKVALHPSITGALLVSFRVLDGPAKGRLINDTVNYDPDSSMSWKYQALRRAVGQEYKSTEPEKIDIEKILLNKALVCDFSKRVDSSGKEWQNVKYKSFSKGAALPTSSSDEDETPKSDGWEDETDDEELPF